ncbi:nuclear transport factor 2 family protein [Flavobacterium sp. J372]|uniref:nuclear transport factor 2 family protein n=1 Tax=Flavobacterium sp. J372 TaxID=2898436 RepID=UPI002151F5C3|nr:nuclear transport factor 2 family protein [Flavobacterium sp. J372]MCR5862616.1 nuclear transport factor 2 family protein [Flavobacterium sp. J372]MCR5863646.1 nuclear transport factor 2 family protein [Flavobacterium sp. J372]
MTESNKQILQRANEAIARGDYEGFLAECTEDTKWEFLGDRTLQGKEAVRQYMAEVYNEPPKFKVNQLIAEGNYVTAIGQITLKNENGQIVDYDYCDVWRFTNGKMAELKAFVIERK